MAGSQYRSVIFYHNEETKKAAEKSKEAVAANWRAKLIVTQYCPRATHFTKAEDYQSVISLKDLITHI